MAASMTISCLRRFSTIPLLYARPGYPPSIRYREVILPRVPTVLEKDEPRYPTIKPSITSGSKAGKQARRDAWIENIQHSETSQEIIYLLNKKQQWQWMVRPFTFQSGFTSFYRHITKTAVVNDMPENIKLLMESEHLKTEAETLSERIKELLIAESFSIQRKKQAKVHATQSEAQSLAQNLVGLLVSYLGLRYSHLNNAVVDEMCSLQSFWHRGDRRIQFNGDPVCSLRTDEPLGLFVAESDEVCHQGVEEWSYDPKDIGIFEKHINSVCFPGFKYHPGHLHAHTQIYGLSFNKLTAMNNGIYQEIQDNYGVLTGYAWLNALAMYQRHCWFNDIPRPMTAQVIFTDGRLFSFYCYQANTLNLLEDQKPVNNVCFQNTMVPLFTDTRDGDVRDFNQEALKLLLAFFMNPTVK